MPDDVATHNSPAHDKQPMQLQHLRQPSTLLRALDDNKTHAQFLFAPDTVAFVVSTLKRLKLRRVVCVGTPRFERPVELPYERVW